MTEWPSDWPSSITCGRSLTFWLVRDTRCSLFLNFYIFVCFLSGVVQNLIAQWLEHIVPDNVDALRSVCYMTHYNASLVIIAYRLIYRHRLVIIAYRIGQWRLEGFCQFETQRDLIECLLASVHIPFYSNGKPFAKARGSRYFDGSFGKFPLGPTLKNFYFTKFETNFRPQHYRIVRPRHSSRSARIDSLRRARCKCIGCNGSYGVLVATIRSRITYLLDSYVPTVFIDVLIAFQYEKPIPRMECVRKLSPQQLLELFLDGYVYYT